MSRIHAKPYIRKVIDSLSDLQKVALLGLVNGETPIGGSANPTPKSLLNPSQYINGSDKNVAKYVALETAEGTYTGFLIYTNAYCCLVAYQDDSQNLDILDLDLSNMTYKVNGENTSIADLRFEIEQSKEKMDVVAYIEEAIQEGDIAIDAANVISLENVDLSEGSDTVALSPANWILATDRDHECVLNLYLATQNVYPIGDVVELNRIAVSDDEVTFGGTFDYPNDGTYIGYTISAVFTEQSGSIHIVETEANKELNSGEYPALHNITIGGETYVVPEGSSDDMEVEIATDAAGTTFGTAITGLEFVANCESGTYDTPGTIARITNKNTNEQFRIILIGVNHDTLAKDNSTKAKTTWQYYDMPMNACRLGLPFNVIDWGSASGRSAANAYLDGTNENALTWYPSNKAGYPTAAGLMNATHVVYDSMPSTLQHALKMVRKQVNIPRNTRSIAATGGAESDSSTTAWIGEVVFHLSATECGNTGYGTEDSAYSWMNSAANRIRYFNGSASYYWLRTPYPGDSRLWVSVYSNGTVNFDNTDGAGGVAPAFCI